MSFLIGVFRLYVNAPVPELENPERLHRSTTQVAKRGLLQVRRSVQRRYCDSVRGEFNDRAAR